MAEINLGSVLCKQCKLQLMTLKLHSLIYWFANGSPLYIAMSKSKDYYSDNKLELYPITLRVWV